MPPPTSFARRQPPVYDKGKGSNSPWPEGGDVRYDQGAGQGWDLASLRPAQNHENRPSAWPAVQGDEIMEGEIICVVKNKTSADLYVTFPLYLFEGVLHSSVTTWIVLHFNITDTKLNMNKLELWIFSRLRTCGLVTTVLMNQVSLKCFLTCLCPRCGIKRKSNLGICVTFCNVTQTLRACRLSF